jgi:phenylacetate-CoA ligase
VLTQTPRAVQAVVRHVVFPVASRVLCAPSMRALEAFRASERADPAVLRARQDAHVRVLVRHAYETVPYYHRVMRDAGLVPNDIQGVEDLPKLPILRRQDVRQAGRDMVSRLARPRDLRPRMTSGTTGEPLRFHLDRRVAALGRASIWHGFEWAGVSPASRILMAAPTRTPEGRSTVTPWNRLCGGAAVRADALHKQQIEPIMAQLDRVRPEVIRGYPSLLHPLAQLVVRAGRAPASRPMCVWYQGEQMGVDTRQLLAAAFGAPIFSRYGAQELSGAAAQTCGHGGWHICTEVCVVEIVSGRVGERGGGQVPAGRLIVTDLRNFAAPFVRYETTDLGVAAPDAVCPCGRTLPLLGAIEGRATEIIVTRSGQRMAGYLATRPLSPYWAELYAYQLRQPAPGELDLLVVPGPRYAADSAQRLARAVADQFGDDVTVRVREVDHIAPEPSGKRRGIIGIAS